MRAPCVLKRGSNTAVVVMALTSQVSIVPMTEGELKIRTTDYDTLAAEGWAEFNYPAEQAIQKYLNHAGGLSKDARRALEDLAAANPQQQQVKETTEMSIEQNLQRIADGIEKLIDLTTGTNLLLEQITQVSTSPAAEAAAEVIEKASTKGRRKKGEEPAAEAAPAPAEETKPEAAPAPAPETKVEAPAAAPAAEVKAAPAVEAKPVTVPELQKMAAALATKNRQAVLEAISSFGGAQKISDVAADQLSALKAKFEAIANPAATEEF